MSKGIVNVTTTPSPPSPPKAEPGPDWPVAKQQWGLAWEFHWIGLGVLFALLALWSITGLVRAGYKNSFARKPLYIAITILLVILGVTRALYLWIDPYESGENSVTTVPPYVTALLLGLTYPCLTSSFCLIHLAFLEVTKIQLPSRRLQKPSFLASVIALHFVVVLFAEIMTSVISTANWLLVVCQSFFILWSLLLSASFLYSGGKLLYQSKQVRRRLGNIRSSGGASKTEEPQRQRSATAKVARITVTTSVLGLLCCALQTYSLFGVYGLYSTVVHPQPWPWWVFQTCFRLVELVMACTIAYSVQQPADRTSTSSAKPRRPDITLSVQWTSASYSSFLSNQSYISFSFSPFLLPHKGHISIYSWTPLTRSPKGKRKRFELTGVRISEVKVISKALQGKLILVRINGDFGLSEFELSGSNGSITHTLACVTGGFILGAEKSGIARLIRSSDVLNAR